MLKLKRSFLVLVSAFSAVSCSPQNPAVATYQNRFNNYLNFKGSLTPYVSITGKDVRIYKNAADKAQDEPELLIDYSEIKTFEYLLKYAPQDSIESILKRKGADKWSKRTVGELLIQYEEEPRQLKPTKPLEGKKILIDPGHIAGNHDMAWMEQKYICFRKDSCPALPVDSIRLQEGVLTFATASILKKRLEEQGASVVLTRGENKTVFGVTYYDWLDFRKKKVLDSLKIKGELDAAKHKHLLGLDERDFFWEFFRDFELAARARYINKQNPDLTIIIHYNVDEKNTAWSRPSDKNYTMVFMPGAMSSDVFRSYNGKLNFLRLLLTDDLPLSEKISSLTLQEFNKQLGVTPAEKKDAQYLEDNCISTVQKGVFCRNLALCKSVKSPLVYGECLFQDNKDEYLELSRSDKTYYGIRTNARVKAVSDAYYNAILQFYKK
jgi:N-acetylmuramoyl-L-alanine amidase